MANEPFPLGRVVITAGAKDGLHPQDIAASLRRHANCDWGDLCDADRRENGLALVQRRRLFSAYTDRSGTKFWIITEADRSATTILLPDDY